MTDEDQFLLARHTVYANVIIIAANLITPIDPGKALFVLGIATGVLLYTIRFLVLALCKGKTGEGSRYWQAEAERLRARVAELEAPK